MERKDSNAAEETMAKHIGEYMRYAERKFPEVLTRRVVWNF
jgi:GntR family transcriptional repressor for pyruvate dehydrogenase complex